MDAREVALLTLTDCRRQGGWSDGVFSRKLAQAGLTGRDAALATQICFGVLQNRTLLDFYLSEFSNIPLKRMERKVIEALRIGTYQMLFLTRIPHSAAVNSTVSMIKSYCKNPRAAGMVNAILRSIERNLDNLPTIPNTDTVTYLSTLYSHPSWIVEQFIQILGEQEASHLLAVNNSQPPITAMVNTTRINMDGLLDELEKQGIGAEKHPWLDDCLVLSKTGGLEQIEAFSNGDFYIQDPASRLAVMAANPQPGWKVMDCCAAPGGKSFSTAILMKDKGEVLSCDIRSNKKKFITEGAARLQLHSIHAETADGRIFCQKWEEQFDLVLVDAPCSGLGVIWKKPDIRYKDPSVLKNLPVIQADILNNASHYVKPGGVLLYSTCTVLQRENEDVISAFLNKNQNFHTDPFSLPGPIGDIHSGILTLWPHKHGTDGFFMCRLRKETETVG